MIDTLIMMAALVTAIVWIIYLQRVVDRLTKRMTFRDRQLHSAKLTVTGTMESIEKCIEENETLKQILVDVANGDAHVWIGEDGRVRAKRKHTGETPIH